MGSTFGGQDAFGGKNIDYNEVFDEDKKEYRKSDIFKDKKNYISKYINSKEICNSLWCGNCRKFLVESYKKKMKDRLNKRFFGEWEKRTFNEVYENRYGEINVKKHYKNVWIGKKKDLFIGKQKIFFTNGHKKFIARKNYVARAT